MTEAELSPTRKRRLRNDEMVAKMGVALEEAERDLASSVAVISSINNIFSDPLWIGYEDGK